MADMLYFCLLITIICFSFFMDKDKPFSHHSALSVNKGIDQPPATNQNAINRFKQLKRKVYSTEDYISGILEGNRVMLGKAITLIESILSEHQEQAQAILEACLPYSGKSLRIGITGVPGVGKSTFIESLGKHLTKQKQHIAVLAIDPSSERSKGSILGDKTRMEELSADDHAFIRPSPSSGTLGGVARKTRESMLLCEAAGFNVIFVETVGVGQSETAVHSMVDFFLLLMLAGAGDELQGIKRGIMEMADALVITKADGENIERAIRAKSEYQNALHLFPPSESGWVPKVSTCSSLYASGIAEVWQMVEDYFKHVKNNGFMADKRHEQNRYWMYESIEEQLKQHFYKDEARQKKLKDLENKVLAGTISSFNAAQQVMNNYFDNIS